jgi:hypothetical protein
MRFKLCVRRTVISKGKGKAKQSRFNNNIFLNMCFSYFFHIILNDNTTLSGVGMSFNICIENVLFTKNKFSQLEKSLYRLD